MELPIELLEERVGRGVILLSDMFEKIDHSKFFVVVAVTSDLIVGFFYINSQINKGVIKKEEQFELQYMIREEEYEFLDHDSYICGTSLKKIGKTKLLQSIQRGETRIIGNIKDEDLAEFLKILRESRLYNKIDKKNFFYE